MCLANVLHVAASTPMVVGVVMSAVAGVVVERLGVRFCLSVGTLVLCLTWVMIAQATAFRVLLIARLIQGLVGELPSVPPCHSDSLLGQHYKQDSIV